MRIIVCGVIEYDDLVLIGKKIEGEHPAGLGGVWHLPGGKARVCENLADALKREIKEETNLDVDIRSQLGYFDHSTARLYFYRCVAKTKDAKPSDDLEKIRWVKRKEVLSNIDDIFKDMMSAEVKDYLSG